jgi:hypothetical protein
MTRRAIAAAAKPAAAAEPAPLAVPVFSEDEYNKLLRVATDRRLLPRSYKIFIEQTERCIEQVLRRRYRTIRRVSIDVCALVLWCRANGLPISGIVRLRYAAEMLKAAAAQVGC